MSEKIKYGNTLVSSRADQTLSYTRYIKDEDSGKSVKELFEEEGSRVNTELDKKFDKANVVQDLGDSEEKVVSQAALPFRYIQSEEFIFAQVDAEDHLLFGIQLDGTPVFGKKSSVEEGLQSQVNLLAERVATIMGDDDTTNVIDTMNELKQFFANIESTQNLTDILLKLDTVYNNLNTTMDKVNKTVIKDEEGNVMQTPFKVIDSPEFLHVLVDAEDHFLFGIQQDGSVEWSVGIPSPIRARLQEIINKTTEDKEDLSTKIDEINASFQSALDTKVDKEEGKSLIDDEVKERFEIIENDEWIHAMVDAENHLLFGIRRDTGKPYFPLNEMYHVEQNEEFFALWLDAENHILMGIRRDGQIIGEIHAVTALKEVVSSLQSDVDNLKESVSTIDSSLQELLNVFSLQDNPEFLAVEVDADDKVLAYTDADGSHYAHNMKSETIPEEFSHLDDPEGRTEITTDSNGNILQYRDKDGYLNECVGIKVSKKERERVASIFKKQIFRGYIDYSDEKFVEIPIPRNIAKVNFVTSNENLPTWKGENLNGIIEFWDKDGNYFKKDISNFNVQGDTSQAMPWKNYSFDLSDGSEIKFGNWVPCDSFHLKKYYLDCFRGQCIVAYRIAEQMYQTRTLDDRKPYQYLYKNDAIDNGNGIFDNDFYTGALCHPDGFPIKVYLNGKYKGIWVWALKKARDNYAMQKNNQKHILLDGRLGEAQIWGGTVDWTAFEIRNPKVKKDIDGNDYDGDNPKEPSSDYEEAKGYIERLSYAISDVNSQRDRESKKSKFKEYFKLNEIIDYFLFGNVFGDGDGFEKNWIWGTWDGNLWSPTYYDKDQIFGIVAFGENPYVDTNTSQILGTNENIPSGLCWALFKEDIKAEYKRLRDSGVFSVNNIIYELEKWIKSIGYNNLKDEIENICVDSNGVAQTPTYRPKNDKQGNPIVYSMFPHNGGFFNSVDRIRNWLESHFTYLDSIEVFDYK